MTEVRTTATDRYLSLGEVAEVLGTSTQTVRRWVKAGELPAYKPGKEWRIREGDLAEFLEARSTPKVQSPLPPPDPRGEGPPLLERALAAARLDEEKTSQAVARLVASEGAPQVIAEFAEDRFRAEVRALGFPDEYFESFIWPLVVQARRAEVLEQELVRLKEESAKLKQGTEQDKRDAFQHLQESIAESYRAALEHIGERSTERNKA